MDRSAIARLSNATPSERALTTREALRLLERGILFVDPDGAVMMMNDAAEEIMGFTEDEVLGRGAHSLWHHSYPDGSPFPREECRIHQALMEGNPYRQEETFWSKSGEPVVVELVSTPMKADGEWIGSLIVMKDLRAYREAQSAIAQSDTVSHLTTDTMPIVIWTTDKDLRFTSSMGSGTQGGPEAVGLTYQEYTGIEDPSEPPLAAHLAALRGEPGDFEMNFIGRVFRAHVEPHRDLDGAIIGVIGAALDVTAEFKAREAALLTESREYDARVMLQRAQSDYRTLVESIPGLSYIDSIGEKTHPIYVSPQVFELFGVTQEEVLNDPLIWVNALHPDDRQRVVEEKKRHDLNGDTFNCEYRIVARDGRMVWVVDQAVVVTDDDGRPIFRHGVIHDMTAHKKKQEEAESAARLDALGRLAAGIAHDFNNLLTTVLGNCHLLLADFQGDPSDKLALQDINAAAAMGRDIVAQLMGFTGRFSLEDQAADLGEVVVALQSLLARMLGEDIDLQLSVGVDPLPVAVGTGELEQVVLNLLVNARDAMPRGGTIEISTAVVSDSLDAGSIELPDGLSGPHALLTVSDTGTGMNEATKRQIFEPFFSTKDRGSKKGRGLGLATVYGIVKRRGGRIDVSSEVGSGTSIRVYLPISLDKANVAQIEAAPEATLDGLTVLLVEDEKAVRAIARRALERHDVTVLEAEDGASALALAEDYDGAIDLLLSDVVMPGMNGVELAERFAALRPELPVLFMTGHTEEFLSNSGLPAECHVMKKPFTPSSLVERIASLLGRGLTAA